MPGHQGLLQHGFIILRLVIFQGLCCQLSLSLLIRNLLLRVVYEKTNFDTASLLQKQRLYLFLNKFPEVTVVSAFQLWYLFVSKCTSSLSVVLPNDGGSLKLIAFVGTYNMGGERDSMRIKSS